MSGIYLRCTICNFYRPRREFADHGGKCRACEPPVAEKRCDKCDTVKPIGHFHVDRHSTDGRRNTCNRCRNGSSRENWRNRRARRSMSSFNGDHIQRLIVSKWAT